VQWTPDLVDVLATGDIGIAPNELPIRDRLAALEATAYPDPELMYEPFDHLLRFKASTNPGRFYPFAAAGVPVISDFAPSAAQVLVDRETGLLASSPHAWYEALSALADAPEQRTRLAANLLRRLDDLHARQVDDFVTALGRPPLPAPVEIPGALAAEAQLERASAYARPQGPLWRRLLARIR
jgi:glycosyltransferase involved in cell wall biosynthesis